MSSVASMGTLATPSSERAAAKTGAQRRSPRLEMASRVREQFFDAAFHAGSGVLVWHEPREGVRMLFAKSVSQGFAGFAITAAGLVRGIDQAVGDAAHGGNDGDHGKFARSVGDDLRGTPDAGGVADGGTAKLHDL